MPQSFVGHTEGSAGAVGLMLPLLTSRMNACAPLLHLRFLNPHAARMLSGSTSKHIYAPRVKAPEIKIVEHAMVSTSSFGMSGVNAHAICCCTASIGEFLHTSVVISSKEHFCPVNMLYVLIWNFNVESSTVELRMDTELMRLKDHMVRDHNILPAAAILEASLQTLSIYNVNKNTLISLQRVSFLNALDLGASTGCHVELGLGSILLRTTEGLALATCMAYETRRVQNHVIHDILAKRRIYFGSVIPDISNTLSVEWKSDTVSLCKAGDSRNKPDGYDMSIVSDFRTDFLFVVLIIFD